MTTRLPERHDPNTVRSAAPLGIDQSDLPLPPLELRRLIGSPPDSWAEPESVVTELPREAYDHVLDFGCGCGRIARLFLKGDPRPRQYVGIDAHRAMIDWCITHLAHLAPGFRFVHHDVWSSTYGRDNRYQAAAPFPVETGAVSLVIALSVFTHLTRPQAAYYLHEVSRVLRPGGVAFTSWFFFDRESFPFWRGKGPYALYASDTDPAAAVLYDRRWFLETVRLNGLRVRSTNLPILAGHQWQVYLEKRTGADAFPLGEDGAEWLCGATRRPLAVPSITSAEREFRSLGTDEDSGAELVTAPPALAGPIADLAGLKQSWSWRIGRAVTWPLRVARQVVRVD